MSGGMLFRKLRGLKHHFPTLCLRIFLKLMASNRLNVPRLDSPRLNSRIPLAKKKKKFNTASRRQFKSPISLPFLLNFPHPAPQNKPPNLASRKTDWGPSGWTECCYRVLQSHMVIVNKLICRYLVGTWSHCEKVPVILKPNSKCLWYCEISCSANGMGAETN